jgi:hypothetical protein
VDAVEDIRRDLKLSLPTASGWVRTSHRSRYRNTLARWCALAWTQINGTWRDGSYYDGWSIDELNMEVDSLVAQSAVGRSKILVPDFPDLKRQIETGLNDSSVWLDEQQQSWRGLKVTGWSVAANPKDFLNPGPEVHYDKLRVWYKKHWHLYQIAQQDLYSAYTTRDARGWIVDVDWRSWLKRYNLNPKRHAVAPGTLIRQATSITSGTASLVEQERENIRSRGFDPDDPDVYDQVDKYVFDLRFLRDQGWVDPDPAWLHVTGDLSKGAEKPLAEVAKESAAKMKEVLASAKQDANFTPAPMPGGLVEVQFPIYDRQQKGYRILNRVWSPQQRLAFIKHTLDTMSGIPIKAQELDILSASGMPVPRDAVTLDYQVAWRCPLTGLFHDPSDGYFISDLHACQSNWQGNGNTVNASQPDDEWYLAHRPWTVQGADYDSRDRYWSITVPAGFPDQKYRG